MLTMHVLYRLSYLGNFFLPNVQIGGNLERETGFEPATLSLEG